MLGKYSATEPHPSLSTILSPHNLVVGMPFFFPFLFSLRHWDLNSGQELLLLEPNHQPRNALVIPNLQM
jgi:hypothetical protein